MDHQDVKPAFKLVELRNSILAVQAAFGADPIGATVTIKVIGAPIVLPDPPGGTQDGIRASLELDGPRMNRFAAFLGDLLTNVENRLGALGVTWTV